MSSLKNSKLNLQPNSMACIIMHIKFILLSYIGVSLKHQQRYVMLRYILTHVVGTASFGHYWIYIYDFKEKIWRKYNDEHVDRVDDLKQVFGQEGSNPATPYFLVFVKNEETNNGIVESVERKLE